MSKLKIICITLTPAQQRELNSPIETCRMARRAGTPTMAIGQLSEDGERAVFAVLPHEMAMRVLAITNPDGFAEMQGEVQP